MRLLIFCLSLSLLWLTPLKAYTSEIQKKTEELSLEPHKALYEIKLAGAHSGSQILNISGQMFYEWQPVCDAWVTNHSFNLLYEYADSAPLRITSNFSTYESFDGESFNFTSQRKSDGEIFEEIRGSATIVSGQPGSAKYTMPEGLEFELPAGTIFPIAHTIAVAEKLKSGEKFYNTTIFDGSDADGPVQVNSFMGKPVEVSIAESEILDQKLLSSKAHSVRLAFFPLKAHEAQSDYEMDLAFHKNSLISDMIIEYDDFSVSQKLVALEPVEHGCKPSKFND